MNNKDEILELIEDLKSYVNDEVHPYCEYYIYTTLMDYICAIEEKIDI